MNSIFSINIIDNNDFLNKLDIFLKFIPESEKNIILKYKNHKRIQISLLGQLLVRYVMINRYKIEYDKMELKKNINGKPYIEGLPIHYNISHSGEWLIACFSNKEVGVDIERIREPNYSVAKKFFSEEEFSILENEREEIKKKELFFKIWTAKEAYVKMLGSGIYYSFNKFTVNINDNKSKIKDPKQNNDVFLKYYNYYKDYILACCSNENIISNNIENIIIEELIK